MDLFESIQIQAMQGIIDPNDDAWLRKIFRLYSKTFATPLHIVRCLPIEDVLMAFFEDIFENMSDEDRDERIDWLLMSPEERAETSDIKISQKDDQFLSNLNSEVTSGEMIGLPKEQKKRVIPTSVDNGPVSTQKLAELIKKTNHKAKSAGTQIPSPKKKIEKELPEIKMSFDNSNLNNSSWDNLDPLAPPRKIKKA